MENDLRRQVDMVRRQAHEKKKEEATTVAHSHKEVHQHDYLVLIPACWNFFFRNWDEDASLMLRSCTVYSRMKLRHTWGEYSFNV